MKQQISISVALVMLFNLSSGVFAQAVPSFKTTGGNYFPQLEQYKKETQPLVLATEEQRKKQELVSYLGLNPTEYKKAMEEYARKNKIDINDIDISASYAAYSKEIIRYHNDYRALIKVFDKKTYLEVLSEAKSFIGEKGNIITYQGKKYNKVALYHAALHNLATRTKTGYLYNGTWVFKTGQATDFEVKEKVAVMDFIYRVISNDGFYPKDEEALYKMAQDVVVNGKGYFKPTKQYNDESYDAKGVVSAISVLTALSNTSAKKQQSAQVIYNLSKSVMRKDLGAIGIIGGSEALLTLNTDDSLNKLYTLLAEDLYRGVLTEAGLYLVETFSVEELQQRLAGFTSEVNNGLGQYYNAIARRYVYVDPNKNSYDQKRLAESRDESLANYSKVIYTDIFEEIGKEIGKRSNNPKVAQLAVRFANKYYSELNATKQGTATTISGNKVDSPLKRETKIHASLIVGILATTKQKNESLTKAAKVIYNGNWWDINEITQRDKNNTAATYLNAAKKPFNKRKEDMYALVIRTKNIAKFLDVFAQAAMLGKVVVSMPAMISRVANWASRVSKGFRIEMKAAKATTTSAAIKPVEVKNPVAKPAAVKPVEVKPIEVKPIEVKPLEMPKVAPKVIEPVKIPAIVEPIKVPAAQVAKVAPEVAQSQVSAVAKQVKYDILGKYYQRSVAMSVLPFGLDGISKRIGFFLTNRYYLPEAKIAKVKAITDGVAKAIIPEVVNGTISQAELRNVVLNRTLAKIQESPEFTAKEKAEITGRKNYQGIDPANTDSAAATKATATETTATEAAAQVAQGKAPSYVKAEVIAKQKAKKHFKQYKEAYTRSRVQEAYDNIQEAIKYDDKNAAYYHERAMLEYYNFNNKAAAMEDMRTAAKLNPGNRRYKVVLDRWTEELKQEALAQQQMKLSENQKGIDSQNNSESYSQKVYDKLVESGKVPADVKPEAVAKQLANKNFKNYKKAYYKDHKLQEAYEYLNEAIKYDNKNPSYYYERALLKYLYFNNKPGAIEDIEIACKLKPNNTRYKGILERWSKE